jgi:hypothetical protein
MVAVLCEGIQPASQPLCHQLPLFFNHIFFITLKASKTCSINKLFSNAFKYIFTDSLKNQPFGTAIEPFYCSEVKQVLTSCANFSF